MIPMQSWEDFTTLSEKSYNIRALGGQSDTIYGVGSALKNWYGKNWQYRTKLTINTILAKEGLPMYFDLSLMPVQFWANINDGGSDIRVTDTNNNPIPFYLDNLSLATLTGQLWVKSVGDIYIYYGNAYVDFIPDSFAFPYPNQKSNVFQQFPIAFTFADNKTENHHNTAETFTSLPSFSSGSFGNKIITNNAANKYITTNQDDEVGLTGSNRTYSFMVYLTGTPVSPSKIFWDSNGYWYISIQQTTRKILFFQNGSDGATVNTSTTALNLNTWYVIDCVLTTMLIFT